MKDNMSNSSEEFWQTSVFKEINGFWHSFLHPRVLYLPIKLMWAGKESTIAEEIYATSYIRISFHRMLP